MIDAAVGMMGVALRFVALTATTGALGAWFFGRFVLARWTTDADPARHDSLRALSARAAAGWAALVAVTVPIRLVADSFPTLAPDAGRFATVAQAPGSAALMAQGIAAVVASMALFLERRPASWPLLGEVSVAALAIFPALLGHAAEAAEWRAVSVLVDIAHVTAAGAWVGALGLLAWIVVRERHIQDAPSRAASLVAAFHPVALVAAPVVFVTGLATAWLRMGLPEGIASSTYSGLFVAKLLLAGVVGAIGAGHSRIASRRVHAVSPSGVTRTLVAECGFALLVLTATAVLAGTAPIE